MPLRRRRRPVGHPPRVGIDDVLAASRSGVRRLTPHELVAAAARGALVIDTRTESHRRAQGEFPGALVIDRTVLEWRLDPTSPWRIPGGPGRARGVVVAGRPGYSPGPGAASLRAGGLPRPPDLMGGAGAWPAAGLPMSGAPADVRE